MSDSVPFVNDKKGGGRTYLSKRTSRASIRIRARLVVAITNSDELLVEVLEAGRNSVLDSLGDLLLHETGGEGLERLVQQVVLRLADPKIHH